jgi:hypothetical protein
MHRQHQITDADGATHICGGSQTDRDGRIREYMPDHIPVPPRGGFSQPPTDERVVHPPHYSRRVPGIECIEVVQHFNFNLGNVIKYVWRAGDKGDYLEDLRKARQYLDFEIDRVEKLQNDRL